jgi:predicted esterase
VNTNAIGEAAQKFGLERDEAFHRLPIFLQGGQKDRVATPAQHEGIEADLKRDGFRQVRLAFVPGPHAVDASLLAGARRWVAAPLPPAASASEAAR